MQSGYGVKMKIVQVLLKNVGHPEQMVCWIPVTFKKTKIREGMVINLDDVDGLWRIADMYSVQDHHQINRGWNNNI